MSVYQMYVVSKRLFAAKPTVNNPFGCLHSFKPKEIRPCELHNEQVIIKGLGYEFDEVLSEPDHYVYFKLDECGWWTVDIELDEREVPEWEWLEEDF